MKRQKEGDFFNLYRQGFIRAAVCTPEVRIGDTGFNAEQTIALARQAASQSACLALFPELGLSAYSNEDLFHQEALLQGVREALARVASETAPLNLILAVGAPLEVGNRLYNCAVVLYHGRILGVAVKSFLPNYREFYEPRQFSPSFESACGSFSLGGQEGIPFGADLIFEVTNIRHFRFFLEMCEDVWVPVPPSCFAALAGATVIGNLSASNATIGKSEYRQALTANQSARCLSAYLYAAAGPGESTTDLAWDGQALICENGRLLAQSERFTGRSQLILADLDLDRLAQDRMRQTTFGACSRVHREAVERFRRVPLQWEPPGGRLLLTREVPRFPYIPADPARRDERCYEAYHIQVQGLSQRLKASGIDKVVIGVSGGLDSTQALIVAARTMDGLGLPRRHILAFTMPGFATSARTRRNALRLMESLGVTGAECDIRPSCRQMLKDIGHPYARGRQVYDITFENIQAGERTSHLFRIANLRQALVLGTGDLSELALGWCTYGVGDHMSHYNVNASVPKTLIQHLIRWVSCRPDVAPETAAVLKEILDTEISPELIPGRRGGQPAQRTEAAVGPYELQDFNLFYTTRYGYLPSKIAFLAYCAWHDRNRGLWPDIPEDKRREYRIGDIRRWLEVFLYRFFQASQFKRSCAPNGPKVGSGGSLSPRGDYRAPSDSVAALWLEDAARIPERSSGR